MKRVALVLVALVVAGCSGKEAREAEARRQEEERKAKHQGALTLAEAFLKDGEFELAVSAFEKAQKLAPADAATADRLAVAQAALQKLRTGQYDKAMGDGRAARADKKYRAARGAFDAALGARPNDPDATALRKEVDLPAVLEQGKEEFDAKRYIDAIRTYQLAAGKNPADPALKDLVKQARDARRAEVRTHYDEAVAAGQKALAAKNYARASASFGDALGLVPGDPDAAEGKLTADFELHMRRGQDAAAARNPADAIAQFEAAGKLRPGDERVNELLATARKEKALADRERYIRVVNDGKTAMAGRRYKDAVSYFKQAEGIISDHSEATTLRREAEQVISTYNDWISKARSALRDKRFADARHAATTAGTLIPGETEAVLLTSEIAREEEKARDAKAEKAAKKK